MLAGGNEVAGPGRFFEPTVLVDVDHTMKCMTEETFGPTLPIMKVGDAEEALRLANDSPYGLQASVWTKDVRKGEQLARRVEAGAVCVNDAQVNYTTLELPMGGWKTSGLGSRHGAGGIRKYTRSQAVLISRVPLKREIHYFGRKTLFDIPVIGTILHHINVIGVDREGSDVSALKAVIRVLRDGGCTVVFPEGTRTRDGNLQPAKPGAGFIVAKTLAPNEANLRAMARPKP